MSSPDPRADGVLQVGRDAASVQTATRARVAIGKSSNQVVRRASDSTVRTAHALRLGDGGVAVAACRPNIPIDVIEVSRAIRFDGVSIAKQRCHLEQTIAVGPSAHDARIGFHGSLAFG